MSLGSCSCSWSCSCIFHAVKIRWVNLPCRDTEIQIAWNQWILSPILRSQLRICICRSRNVLPWSWAKQLSTASGFGWSWSKNCDLKSASNRKWIIQELPLRSDPNTPNTLNLKPKQKITNVKCLGFVRILLVFRQKTQAWLWELAPGGGDSGEIGRVAFGTRGIVVKPLGKTPGRRLNFWPFQWWHHYWKIYDFRLQQLAWRWFQHNHL